MDGTGKQLRVNAGRYSLAQQHLTLAQSLQRQNCHDSRFGVSPEGLVLSLGQTLQQSLNATDLATRTFECLAPTSAGHNASVNKPGSNGNGASVENKAGHGKGGGHGRGLTSKGACHNSNSSVANGSNGTSVLTANAANSSVPVLSQVPGTNWGSVATSGSLTPDQLLRYIIAQQLVALP